VVIDLTDFFTLKHLLIFAAAFFAGWFIVRILSGGE
jgi:hypothetical protein